jgi:TolB-like protein/two-component SAPR family response regulator
LDRSALNLGAACRSSSFKYMVMPSGVSLCITLSPLSYERRIGCRRERTVVANVKAAQFRQLRSAEGAVGLRIRLLGPMTIVNAGNPVAVPAKKARALVGYLTLREGSEIPRSVLTGLLWGERSEEQARGSLRQTLSELRSAFADSAPQPIIATKEAVSWAPGSAWVDAKVLEAAAVSEDEDALRHAATLIGGELMEGLSVGESSFEHWLLAERTHFRLLAGTVYTRLMERAEQGGRPEEALAHGLKLLSLDPLQEHVHRALMRIYAAQGRHDAALAQYERCRAELSSQIGVSPEAETEALVKSIRASRREGATKTQAQPSPAPEPDAPVLPAKPSIAVLPFQNLSADPEQEFFADGLTEDIITALSRINGLWVIGRGSSFTYKGKPIDAKQVARDLGVRYLMEGSVRRAGERLRITAQLVDATTGHQVWAERYDRALADLFDIQDEITRSVAAETQTQLQLAEAAAGGSRPVSDSKARDLAVRACARLYDQTPEAIAEGSGLVDQAIRLEPLNPVAHRARAWVFFSRLWFGDIPRDPANMERGFELARAALRLAPHDEYAHLVMAYAYAYAADGQLEEAIAECERGLEINPNCSILYGNLGAYLGALGRPQEAIEACRLALKLNPRDPSNFWRHYYIAVAYFVAGDYAACLRDSKRLSRSRPFLASGIMWAAAAAGLGDAKEARAAVDYCLAERPDLRVGSVAPTFMLRFARDEDHERLMALLRKAGLSE